MKNALPGSMTYLEDGNLGLVASDDIDNTPLIVGVGKDSAISDISTDAGNTTDGTVSLSGQPIADMDLVIEIVKTGDVGVMSYKYSIDGGKNYSDEITPAESGKAQPLTNNLDITFTDGSKEFTTGDKFFALVEGSIEPNKAILVTRDSYKQVVGKGSDLYRNLTVFFDHKRKSYGSPAKAYIIRPENDIKGRIDPVTYTNITGGGNIIISGNPKRDMELIIEIVLTEGNTTKAQYRYSKDNGSTWANPLPTPESGKKAYIGDGIYVSFTDGGTTSFKLGDMVFVRVKGPTSSNVLTALTSDLKEVNVRDTVKYNMNYGFIAVCGDTALENWKTMSKILDQIEENHSPCWACMPTKDRLVINTVMEHKTAVLNEAKTFFDKRISLVYSRGVMDGMEDEISMVPVYAGSYSVLPVHKDAGEVKQGNLFHVDAIADMDKNRPFMNELSEGRMVICMDYPKRPGYYFAHSHLMSEATSDYKYVRDIRTANKVRRLAYFYTTNLVKSDIPNTKVALFSIASTVKADIKKDMKGMITDLNIEVTSSLEDLLKERLIVLRILVNGTLLIDNFEVSVGHSK